MHGECLKAHRGPNMPLWGRGVGLAQTASRKSFGPYSF